MTIIVCMCTSVSGRIFFLILMAPVFVDRKLCILNKTKKKPFCGSICLHAAAATDLSHLRIGDWRASVHYNLESYTPIPVDFFLKIRCLFFPHPTRWRWPESKLKEKNSVHNCPSYGALPYSQWLSFVATASWGQIGPGKNCFFILFNIHSFLSMKTWALRNFEILYFSGHANLHAN